MIDQQNGEDSGETFNEPRSENPTFQYYTGCLLTGSL